MPKKPRTPCRHPGCAELVESGRKYCGKHAPLHRHDRPGAAQRGYGAEWRRVRKRFLETHPLCVECLKEGRYVRATDLDHIRAHRGDPKLFWDPSNWQPLCHSHHSKKTAREDMHPEYRY